MQLRLIRLVIATFGTRLTEWSGSAYAETSITVKPYAAPLHESQKDTTSRLFEASRVVDDLPVDGDVLHVPEAIRRDLEMAIESHTDVIAVLNRSLITASRRQELRIGAAEGVAEKVEGLHGTLLAAP
jgi:hypothetical protein